MQNNNSQLSYFNILSSVYKKKKLKYNIQYTRKTVQIDRYNSQSYFKT